MENVFSLVRRFLEVRNNPWPGKIGVELDKKPSPASPASLGIEGGLTGELLSL